ncbi:hypothetical protein [Kribbella sp. CA-293567]|uniref:hypothetical protein n=1 Tax=Kribbella sp. CA-293567 TaxID=3002436 RepID=UPI0022DD4137|nr:hypothetical protein [Kribbella sp. CA-293567]WBQ07865.1 hypothetical protein OX958_13940 [Kribbella sp. CA-293567]
MLYDVALVPASLLAIGGSLWGRNAATYSTWHRLAHLLGAPALPSPAPGLLSQALGAKERGPGAARAMVTWGTSLALGWLGWFLVMLLVTAVVRGPFYGLVESGPYGAGTWGGPSRAGAWAVHAAISVPIVVALLFVLRGLGLLQAAVVRRFYGAATSRWVLPATIFLAATGVLLFGSWTRQL